MQLPQQTSQRSLLAHIGNKKVGTSFREVTLITNIANINQHRFFRQGVGSPNLRTKWEIVAVTFSFRYAELERSVEPPPEPGEFTIPEWNLPLEIKIFAGGGNPVIVDYLVFKQAQAIQKEQLEKLPKIPKKVVVLEVFSPVVTSPQELEIELRIEDSAQPTPLGTTSLRYFMQLVEPEFNFLINQTFPV